MERADYILAFRTDRPATDASERLADAILRLARSLAGFAEVNSFPTHDGATYSLFKTVRFPGYRPAEGLGPEEGPYPQWHLPVVRWGTGAQTRLQLEGGAGGPVRVSLSCRTDHPGRILTVTVD